MVHRGMLPQPQRHLVERECCRCAQGAPPLRRTAGGRGFQHETVESGGQLEGREYRGGTGNGGTRGYVGALTTAPVLMVPVREDIDRDLGGEGGEVLDGLHSEDRSPSLLEYVCTGPQSGIAFAAPP